MFQQGIGIAHIYLSLSPATNQGLVIITVMPGYCILVMICWTYDASDISPWQTQSASLCHICHARSPRMTISLKLKCSICSFGNAVYLCEFHWILSCEIMCKVPYSILLVINYGLWWPKWHCSICTEKWELDKRIEEMYLSADILDSCFIYMYITLFLIILIKVIIFSFLFIIKNQG